MWSAAKQNASRLRSWLALYWRHARRPLVSLAIVMPLVLFYEIALLALGDAAAASGIEGHLRWALVRIGFAQFILLPIATLLVLATWLRALRGGWRFSLSLFAGMAVESVAWSLLLVALAGAHGVLTIPERGGLSIAAAASFVGAGVYEEIVFRLMLLPVVGLVLRRLGTLPGAASVWAVVLSSALFAVAHHIGAQAPPWEWSALVFRFAAGVLLALVFLWRGLGIAVGAHVAYDLLVGLQ